MQRCEPSSFARTLTVTPCHVSLLENWVPRCCKIEHVLARHRLADLSSLHIERTGQPLGTLPEQQNAVGANFQFRMLSDV